MKTINLMTEIPGPKSQDIVARCDAATSRGNGELTPLAIEHASGAQVMDVEGNTFLDFAGGIRVLAVTLGGHA